VKEERSYEPLSILEKYLKDIKNLEGANWFLEKVRELKRSYMIYLGKPLYFNHCIQTYNNIKEKQYQNITSPRELFEKVKEILNEDIKNWFSGEGNHFVELFNDETTLQKLIKTQIENCLLRKGFIVNEILLVREPQLLDDKRVDFLVYYGFIGPIIIETKLSKSSDLKGKLETKKSFLSLKHYMINYKAKSGILLVLNSRHWQRRKYSWSSHLNKIEKSYGHITNVEVIGISDL
jgi:hypothetical protein